MSLIYCPECGNEINSNAVACPHCGRPVSSIPAAKETVVRQYSSKSDVPNWIYIPFGILAAIALVLFLVVFLRESPEGSDKEIMVVANHQQSGREPARTVTTEPGTTITVPSAPTAPLPPPPVSTDSQTVTVPGTTSTAPAPTRGSVVVDAKIRGRNGQPQPVRNEKFYLLDKDLESILFEADLEPIDGQSLANSFGLAMTFPDRYADFRRQALAAIRPHIKHSATSDGSGKASFGNIEPDSYYLFGVTRGDRGFALWSSPVSIRAGQNVLELSPQQLTDVG